MRKNKCIIQLFNLTDNQADIGKMYLNIKDLYEAKYQYLINNHKDVGKRNLYNPEASTDHSNDMQDVYKNIEK